MTDTRTVPTARGLQPTGTDDRHTALVVGVLFLVALVPYLIGGALYGPPLDPTEFLQRAYPERGTVIAGLLVEFLAVAAIPLIAAFLYPVLRRVHQALALAYALLRAGEALLLMSIEAKRWSLIGLSDQHLNTADADPDGLQTIGDATLYEADQLFVLYVLLFAVGALILYTLLVRSRLVPRWLPIWGLAAAAWMLIGTVLITLDVPGTSESLFEVLVVLPLPLNELALAAWLIIRGFDASSVRALTP